MYEHLKDYESSKKFVLFYQAIFASVLMMGIFWDNFFVTKEEK